MADVGKGRAPRNRTVVLRADDTERYGQRVKRVGGPVALQDVVDSTVCGNAFNVLGCLPSGSVDLVFADPPYNLTKSFNEAKFARRELDEYEEWLELWIAKLPRLLKPTASLYICGDWRSSAAIHHVAQKHFVVRNRITWEREKGRGAKTNWKNCSEDIWFCTVSEDYVFNVDAVKLKRRVIAPYTNDLGMPKDWFETDEGRFRTSHPSNLWTDLTVPFWSMPENTDHPTQKPEKLLAKIILASSNQGDIVLDPFVGSGTTSVVAKKLGRRFIGIEIDETYCLLAEKRLDLAAHDKSIQGYEDGVFWERNTLNERKRNGNPRAVTTGEQVLFS